jgi:hypothetical protein
MRLITFVLMMAASFLANSYCSQTGNTLNGLVGLDSSSGVIYAATTSIKNECSCTEVRFKPENTQATLALSILLSAKLAGKTIRVDIRDATDCNTAFRAYVQ